MSADPSQLDRTRPVPDEIKRLAHARVSTAHRVIKPLGKPSNKAVHTARKQLKEARAALRLVRRDIRAGFDTSNRQLRDAGRQLSQLRDAAVMLETLSNVVKEAKLAPAPFACLRVALRRKKEQFESRYDPASYHRLLQMVWRRLPTLRFDHDGWRSIEPSLLRTYRHGRRAMKQAHESHEDDEAWHKWRKRAKDLRHQFEMCESVCPDEFGRIATQAKELGDLLGTDHDLAVMRTAVCGVLGKPIAVKWRDLLVCAIVRRRQRLQHDAAALGAELYRDKPRQFVTRIKRCWCGDGAGAGANPR